MMTWNNIPPGGYEGRKVKNNEYDMNRNWKCV